MSERRPDASDGNATDGGEGDLVDRTEGIADRALGLLPQDVGLPNVRDEAGRVAAFFGSIHSRFLLFVVLFYLAAGIAGSVIALVGAPPLGALHDWFMHVGFYVVIFAFTILYVKAHLLRRRIARGVFAIVTVVLQLFFAWVLVDLVPPRIVVTPIVVEGRETIDAVRRGALPELWIPAVMLAASASLLLMHWLVLARYAGPRPGAGRPQPRPQGRRAEGLDGAEPAPR